MQKKKKKKMQSEIVIRQSLYRKGELIMQSEFTLGIVGNTS